MKLLFLTGKFGMGHYSAAFSLAERVSRVNPEADIVIRDIFEYAMPYYSDKVYHAFGVMVTHCSGTYNKYYNHMERKGPDLKPVFLPWFLKKIKNLLEEEQPDAVISTPVSYTHLDVYKRQITYRTVSAPASGRRRYAARYTP